MNEGKTIRCFQVAIVAAVILAASAASAAASATGPGLLAKLTVGNERPAGYDRDKFNLWTTVPGKGCDTRDWVLYRQSRPRQTTCGAEKGRWLSLYDGVVLTRASQADIDHMVPLAEVWASGGRAWKPRQREAYANDLYPRTLIAVSLSSNRSKGDSDPTEWLPPRRAYICRYLTNWVAVKYRWRLTVDPVERQTIARRFRSCPTASLALPNVKRATVPASQGGGGSTGKADPKFDSCTAAIAAGYGPYRKGIDPEYWWYDDRDGDGTVCES